MNGVNRHIILIKINKKVRLNQYLIIDSLNVGIGMMTRDKPAYAINNTRFDA